ncbi:hypothetical protein METHP14_640018 [Pseudomonas sp. P14-2025]
MPGEISMCAAMWLVLTLRSPCWLNSSRLFCTMRSRVFMRGAMLAPSLRAFIKGLSYGVLQMECTVERHVKIRTMVQIRV